MIAPLDPVVLEFLAAARVGHLATVGTDGRPLVLPVCFAVRGPLLFIALDEKPKIRDPMDLERVRNLQAHPQVALVVGRWDEDWTRLAWVHLNGAARIVLPDSIGEASALHRDALALLRGKYPQYRAMRLEDRPLIVMDIERVKTWGALSGATPGGTT